MRLNKRYGTHLPMLIKAVMMTKGPVLELGMGMFSTPFLHWACKMDGRELVSYEYEVDYYHLNKVFIDSHHKVIHTLDWSTIDIDRPWDVVLVDSRPGEVRKDIAKRLAGFAKFIILHDTEERESKIYHYEEIYPFFKYRHVYDKELPHTSVLSNFDDLSGFKR